MSEIRRLDDTGYHLTSVGKPRGRWYEFTGKPRPASDGDYVDYDGLNICKGSDTRVLILEVGSFVFLTGNRIGEAAEIGKCISFYEAKAKGKPYAWINVQWLWRPEHYELPASFVAHPRELFNGDLFDNNPWEAIEM